MSQTRNGQSLGFTRFLGKNTCGTNKVSFSFVLITNYILFRDHVEKKDRGETSRRLFTFAYSVFKSQRSSFSMIYGTIYILEEFVETDRIPWLLNEFSEMITRCKQHIDISSRHSANISIQEASKLHGQILV